MANITQRDPVSVEKECRTFGPTSTNRPMLSCPRITGSLAMSVMLLVPALDPLSPMCVLHGHMHPHPDRGLHTRIV